MFANLLLVLHSSTAMTKLPRLVSRLAGPNTTCTLLYILDDSWDQLVGDEWISNHSVRQGFFQYMDKKSAQQAKAALDHLVHQLADSVPQLTCRLVQGEPQRVITTTVSGQDDFDLLVLPYPSGGRINGVKLKLDRLYKQITCPVLILPN